MGAIQQQPSAGRRFPATLTYVLGAFLAGGLLWVITLTAEYLVLPTAWEPFARLLQRTAHVLRFPVLCFVAPFVETRDHHFTHPSMVFAVTSFVAPLFWAAILFYAWRIVRTAKTLLLAIKPSPSPTTISRRAFLVTATSAIAVPSVIGGYAVLVEPQRVRLARYTIPIRDLPPALDGFRVVHISDTHYGPFISLPYIRAVIDQANALQGDLVILTGDYVHRTPLAIGPGVDVLRHLKARRGVVATLGNHDHWEGANSVRAAFAEIRLPLIDNARYFVTRDGLHDEPIANESICIGGAGDLWEDKTRFDLALADAPDSMPRILLAHNPDTAELVEPSTRVDLMCSGHTHGGQVWIPGFGTPVTPSAYGQKYAGGLCQGPRCPVLVSRGVGMAIMPVRFGVPPEIGEITLKRA